MTYVDAINEFTVIPYPVSITSNYSSATNV